MRNELTEDELVTGQELVNKIRTVTEDADEAVALSALAFVLVERTLNVERPDGETGSRSAKDLIAALTFGMVDIATDGRADASEHQ
jgi:hypothetical protein